MFRNVRFFERVRDTSHTTGEETGYPGHQSTRTSGADGISTVLDEQQSRKIFLDEDELFREFEEQRIRKITSDHDAFSGLLDQPESESLEFMSPEIWCADTLGTNTAPVRSPATLTPGEDARFIIAKTIAGFLNTGGGNLIMDLPATLNDRGAEYHPGIHDDPDLKSGTVMAWCERMIIDSVQRHFDNDFFSRYTRFLSLEWKKMHGRTMLWIQIQKSDRPLFVQCGDTDVFFVRTGAQTREIRKIKDLYGYLSHHFPR